MSNKTLIEAGALRQFKHNDGSEGSVAAYDLDIVNRVTAQDALDAARYRALFEIKDFMRDPLWPIVLWMRDHDISKDEIDAALDAALKEPS